MSKQEKSCFIIMPFSKTTDIHTEEYWTEHYEEFLKPVTEEIENVTATRSEALRGDLLNNIIFNLVNSDIVIADLTDSNPNVFWELGIRHSFKNGTITIMDNNYELPFDLSKIGTLKYYPNNHTKNERFKRKLKRAILDCCENPDKPDSYVLEVISGRGSIYEIINKNETKRKLEGLLSEFEWNKKLYNEIFEHIENNEKIRKEIKEDPKKEKELSEKISFPSRILRNSSIENLIISRYLTISKESYKNYEALSVNINAWITKINEWPRSTEWAEKWLKETNKSFLDSIDKYYKEITSIYDSYT